MKYAVAIFALAIGAFASPQAPSVTSAPVVASIPSGLTPAVSCALACTAGDVTCQAACLGNARPNASQVIDTNKCAANCDQGDGSTAASQAYAKCVASCINSFFPSSQTAFGGAAAAASSAVSAAHSATSSIASRTASPGSSVTGTGASTQATAAADMNSARIASAGLAGLLAIFAL